MLVQRVDQRDEPRRLVAHVARHHRNADDDDGMEPSRDREVIGRSAGFAAQSLE
jgi:hypothetical protein